MRLLDHLSCLTLEQPWAVPQRHGIDFWLPRQEPSRGRRSTVILATDDYWQPGGGRSVVGYHPRSCVIRVCIMSCGGNPNRNRYRYRNRKDMGLGHEKLDVYRLSIGYVAWVYEKAGSLNGVHRPARDQWLRASQSIPLNIAEGNGKAAPADRRRYFEIARGSALECAAIQDVLVVGKALDEVESKGRKSELDRMAAMLSRLGGRGYCCVQEDSLPLWSGRGR